MTDNNAAAVAAAFGRALGDILARVAVFAGRGEPPALAVAYSGGLDSSVLLRLAHDYASMHGMALRAFHVHHGISPHADAWQAHCARECGRLAIAFDARRVQLQPEGKGGLEHQARVARYGALGEMCRRHAAGVLLTAHHQDDQAETVLLQLLRGSGVAGLSGMEALNDAPGLLGPGVLAARPLLGLTRAALAAYAGEHAVAHIEDESNADTSRTRNALRHRVLPALAELFPGYQQRLARSAEHMRAAHGILDDVAASDLAACADGEALDIARLRQLGAARIDNLLRFWFAQRAIRMPSTAWLHQMRTQLLAAKADARLRVVHPDCEIHRHRGRVFITPRTLEGDAPPPQAFRWKGEARIAFPAFGGSLHFEFAEDGIDAGLLREAELAIRLRSGGERLKLAANRPSRPLKAQYQALDVPAWDRPRLPVVFAEGRLMFAAGLGVDARFLSVAPEPRVRVRWAFDST